MYSKTSETRLLPWVIFLAALGLRIFHLDLPFVEPYNNITRQAVGAMIAKNFYRHPSHFFRPEIDLNGNEASLFDAEMQIPTFLMALGYKLMGGVSEWPARLVSVLFSMGALYFLYSLVRRLTDADLAAVATAFAAVSPLNLALSRSIQPEAAMLFGSIGALHFFLAYHQTKKTIFLFLSSGLLWLAIASKAYTLYLIGPMAFIAWKFQGPKMFSDVKNALFLLLGLSSLLWYAYMWRQAHAQQLVYFSLNYDRGTAYHHFWELFAWRYLAMTAKIFFIHLLTPVGSFLFALGLFRKDKPWADRFFQVWFLAVALYILFFWRIFIDHSYYQLPLLPPAAYFVAQGASVLANRLKTLSGSAVVAVASLFCIVTALSLGYFYKGIYFIPQKALQIVEAGKSVDAVTPKDSLVVVSDGTPMLLYYCNRKGWEHDYRQKTVGDFEGLLKKGASHFVTCRPESLAADPFFGKYLRTRFAILKETPACLIFDLKRPPVEAGPRS